MALVRVGYSNRSAARAVGASETAVRRWVAGAERRETTREKDIDARARAIRERLLMKQEAARERLLDRIVASAEAATLRDAAVAFGILSDKARLERGEPTQIVRSEGVFEEYVRSLSGKDLEAELADLMEPVRIGDTEV